MKLKHLAIASIACLIPSMASAKEFTTAELLQNALSMECIDYCVVGVCFWLKCTPFGCSINTSARIRHYLPDMVVSVYDESSENPWTEYKGVMSVPEQAVSAGLLSATTDAQSSGSGSLLGGNSIISPESGSNIDVRFKESSAIGHPFALIAQDSFGGYLCPSNAVPFKPYFSSVFDGIAWRWGVPDNLTPASLIPGMREIGSMTVSNPFGNTWGAVFPRQGMIVQQDDVKGSAVIAQRVVDIVTNSGQPHVYIPFDSDEQTMSSQNGVVTTSGPANEKGDRWQQISPHVDQGCATFGSNSASWSQGRDDGERRYGWAYWRQYECCTPGDGVYIGHIYTAPICLNN